MYIGYNVILYNIVIGTIPSWIMALYSVENPIYYLERVKLRKNRFLK